MTQRLGKHGLPGLNKDARILLMWISVHYQDSTFHKTDIPYALSAANIQRLSVREYISKAQSEEYKITKLGLSYVARFCNDKEIEDAGRYT